MKELIRKLLLLVCACVFVYSAYQLTSIYFDYKEIEKDTENLIVDYVEEPTSNTNNNQDEGSKNEEPKKEDPLKRVVKFNELIKVNADVVGWIYIPDTNINEPLVKGETNDTYLYTNFNKSS